MRLSYALEGSRAWELPIPGPAFGFANWHKLNDIQVLQFWKLSHAVRLRFICVQSERMKQFLSAFKRQKEAQPVRRAPISAELFVFFTVLSSSALGEPP
jgi:hypothetical protein